MLKTNSLPFTLRTGWPVMMLCAGLSLLGWFIYGEIVWQSYVHTRWGRFDLQFDGLKSFVLLVAAYLITGGWFLRSGRRIGSLNRTRMKLLRSVLLVASAAFVVVTVFASLIAALEIRSSGLDWGLFGLLFGLLGLTGILLLVATAVFRSVPYADAVDLRTFL